MFVDRKKIVYTNIGTSAATINVPINLTFTPIDNSELVEDKFVQDEIDKAINPIVDYKKVIFQPADEQWNLIRKFKISLNFFKPDNLTYSNMYNVLNFKYDDLFCRTQRFINSYLRLTLWDTSNTSNNNVLGFSDIYTQVGEDQETTFGFVKNSNVCPISLTLGNPVLEPETIHEGYNIYWYKDIIDESPNKEYTVYVTAQYNNAANGSSPALYTIPTPDPSNIQMVDVNATNGPFYMKIIFKNDNGVYKYKFTPNNTKQLSQSGGGINLSPSVGIPTITFWEISP